MTLRPLTGGDPLPRPHREAGDDLIRPLDTQSGGDPVRAGHREDIAQLVASQGRGQKGVTAVCLVASNPPTWQPTGEGGVDQPSCQLRLRGEPDRVRHPGLSPPNGVLGPRFRQIDSDVEQGVPGR